MFVIKRETLWKINIIRTEKKDCIMIHSNLVSVQCPFNDVIKGNECHDYSKVSIDITFLNWV